MKQNTRVNFDRAAFRFKRNPLELARRFMNEICQIPKGAIAQLVERLNRTQEVSGSTPLSSTAKNTPKKAVYADFGVFIVLGHFPRFRNILQFSARL